VYFVCQILSDLINTAKKQKPEAEAKQYCNRVVKCVVKKVSSFQESYMTA